MEKTARAERPSEDYRRLPPRITPEEMIPLQPVVHVPHDPREGDDDAWRIRGGTTA
ncbi:hypothetical protein ACIBSW_24130 [Actinoplanes sp. NPDC049668]|uniref:hypothetical protein n=1 Tax=unclassified Actinoplanes TaxID=2626549 RepID=UPI0033BC787A